MLINLNSITYRINTWRKLQHILIGSIAILLLCTAGAFLIPTQPSFLITNSASAQSSNTKSAPALTPLSTEQPTFSKIHIRSGLFKSSSPLRRRSMGDSVLEQIRARLALRFVMLIKGEPVGFVKIKDRKGSATCHIGDNIGDIFRVLDVDLDQQCMEIEIAGKKVTLRR